MVDTPDEAKNKYRIREGHTIVKSINFILYLSGDVVAPGCRVRGSGRRPHNCRSGPCIPPPAREALYQALLISS